VPKEKHYETKNIRIKVDFRIHLLRNTTLSGKYFFIKYNDLTLLEIIYFSLADFFITWNYSSKTAR